jgi:hypothetical protein
VSLWETIPRSLATTFITLLPIVALLIFGGATLNDFAFALLIGIASGAYSSIFVAAPLLDWLKEREPEYARRKHEELGDVQSVGGAVVTAATPTAVPTAPPTLLKEADALLATEGPATPVTPPPDSSSRARRQARRTNRKHGRNR